MSHCELTNEAVSRSSRRRRTIAAATMAAAVSLAAGAVWIHVSLTPDEQFTVVVVVRGEQRKIDVEAFFPPAERRHDERLSAIVLLHGIEGPRRYQRAHYRTARRLAAAGHAVFLVHHFDTVGYDDLWLMRSDGEVDTSAVDAYCRRDSECWITGTAQVLSAIAARPEIDAGRIALHGNSLGGFLALSVAEVALVNAAIPDVRAVVVNWGAFFETARCSRGFPPTLLVHGEFDRVVPLAWAQGAAERIRDVESEAILHVISKGNHVARSVESEEATFEFLERHLGKNDGSAAIPDANDNESSSADLYCRLFRDAGAREFGW